MTHAFDKEYWERHWHDSHFEHPPNPYLATETGDLAPGTALDAGCGTGAEAVWLAAHGWQVTAADISAAALARAAERATDGDVAERVRLVEADLCDWQPEQRFDLVTTHYAHPAMPQLEFYDRIADWVAPGGTLLIVGHRHGHDSPAEASVTAEAITARLDEAAWHIVTAEEHRRALAGTTLHDVVVRARKENR
ncbi:MULTISPECIES: class I SAM-dependent methyltransferase [Amycolatopsis]|uniref:class I SAM-dependent methyltransferase n=1 Tax=Amycolatopsis TaxID=1813 RepID=UPI0031F74D27